MSNDLVEREERTRWRAKALTYVPPKLLLRSFNRVTPLRDGRETFPAMLEAIAGARRRVHLQMYILRADRTGDSFKEKLLERRRAGIEVRLLYDSVGSIELPRAYLAELEGEGVEVLEFNPVAPWRRRWGLNRRNHQKTLVVDDAIGFAGGINIGDEYAPVELGGGGWCDMNAKLEGPAVLELAKNFRRTWLHAGGKPFSDPRRSPSWPGRAGFSSDVAVVSDFGVLDRSRMRQCLHHAIRRAEKRVSLMNAYFIPTARVRRTLRKAVRRGVEVRVIVPSVSDVAAVRWASRHLYSRLLRSGVRILEWPDRMMHAKSAVVDGVWSTIGSFNIDMRSFRHNLEAALVVLDPGLGARMETQFDLDAAGCKEIRLAEWVQRPRWHRYVEWLFYQMRYWL